MKKLFISLLMAIGLTGLAMAQTTSLTVTGEGYFSAKATVTLSADDKTTVDAADALMFVLSETNTPIAESPSAPFYLKDLTVAYKTGDIVAWFYPVVSTATLSPDKNNAATLNLTVPAGTDKYLQLYTGKKTTVDESTTWAYTHLVTSTDKFQTKASKIELSAVTDGALKAKIYLDDTLMKQVKSASTLLAVANPSMTKEVYHSQTTRYAVGDRTANSKDGFGATKVVYHNTPTFTDDWCEIDVTGLEAGESGYIVLCTGKEENGAWTYSQGFLMSQEYKVDPLDITATEVEYSTLKASVTLNEAMAAAYNASAGLVAVPAPYPSVPYLSIATDRTIPFEVGEELNGLPVVFVGKPALTADNKLEFTCPNLTPGATVYLNFFLCFETDGAYSFDDKFFAHAQTPAEMKAIAAPTELTAGPIANGKLPLTIKADANFATMIVKSPSAKSIQPQGNLKAGDTYNHYDLDYDAQTSEMIRDLTGTGTVVAVLAPGVKTYDLPMEAGEACYVHAYAVANAETDAAAYAADMLMTPVYRMAERLPLSYTFSAYDYIDFDYQSMPILPPGLSTTANPTEEELQEYINSAFHIDMMRGDVTDQYLLWSAYPASDGMGGRVEPFAEGDEAGGEEPAELRWIDWVTPEFTGVSLVQARFKTMFISNGYQTQARKVAEGDEVRIEYNVNGGEWQALQTFAAAAFPAQEGSSYNLTVDFKCKPTDVVRLRYSYRSTVTGCVLAVAGYEIVEGRNCAAPEKLQAVAESITGSAIALRWQDQNVDEPESFMVYYENAAVPAANGLLSATATTATIDELLPSTTYNVRVQAVCGRGDSSFFSAPIAIATGKGIPYSESLAPEVQISGYPPFMSISLVSKPDVTVYAQADLETPKAEWNEVEYAHVSPDDYETAMGTMSWNTFWSPENPTLSDMAEMNYYSIGIHTKADMALMTTPVIDVPESETPLAKTLTFKANPWKMGEDDYGYYIINNADLPADIRLYVLASTDGFATWDTVATFDHTDLYDADAAENPDAGIGGFSDDAYLPDMGVGGDEGDEDNSGPGKLMTVNLAPKYQGALQLGFYFRAPECSTDDNCEQAFLELHSVKLDYDQRIQPYDLAAAATEVAEDSAIIRWKGDGDLYRIYYALNSADQYTDSVDIEAVPGTMSQSVILRGLEDNTTYKVGVVSYSAGYTKASAMATTTFTTLERMYTVSAIVTPEGAGTVTGDGRYFKGRTARLTATPNDGYKFVGWEAGDEEISDETELRINVTQDTTVTAVFEAIPTYTLTLTAEPAEGGTVEGAGTYRAGTNITVKATANEGYKFTGWKFGSAVVSQNAEYTLTMPHANTAMTAVFEAIPTYTLTLTASPAEGGKVEGAGSFEADADVTIKATANEGYQFVAWKNGEAEVSTEAEYSFKMPANDTAFTAVFEKIPGSANEALLRAAFKLSTADGQLYIRNLKGITITDIDVHTLNGQRIHRFLPNSNEDLILPVDARRAILFIRLNSVEGAAIYKVYMQ